MTVALAVFNSSIWAYLTGWTDSVDAERVGAAELSSSESILISDEEETESFLARLLMMASGYRKMRNEKLVIEHTEVRPDP